MSELFVKGIGLAVIHDDERVQIQAGTVSITMDHDESLALIESLGKACMIMKQKSEEKDEQ